MKKNRYTDPTHPQLSRCPYIVLDTVASVMDNTKSASFFYPYSPIKDMSCFLFLQNSHPGYRLNRLLIIKHPSETQGIIYKVQYPTIYTGASCHRDDIRRRIGKCNFYVLYKMTRSIDHTQDRKNESSQLILSV